MPTKTTTNPLVPFGETPFAQMPFGQMMDAMAMSRLAFDWWKLCFDSTQVIALRSMRMMQGGALAQHEAVRMVSEKWETATLVVMNASSGKGGTTPEALMRGAMQRYQTKVSSNRRRLTR